MGSFNEFLENYTDIFLYYMFKEKVMKISI